MLLFELLALPLQLTLPLALPLPLVPTLPLVPLPATVVTAPVATSTRRILLLPKSATNNTLPSVVRAETPTIGSLGPTRTRGCGFE